VLLRRARAAKPFGDEGTWLAHLQVFLAVRDRERRVALLRPKRFPGEWMLPSENVFEGRDPGAVLDETIAYWFTSRLEPRLASLQNYPPEDGDGHWMVVLVYEAEAPARLAITGKSHEVRFFPLGKAPGPMFKDHAAVWAGLPP
jgi:hypothetical protein